jgi:hypothetical protein
MLISLLQRGETYVPGLPNPDISDRSAIQLSPIPPWNLPSSARALVELAYSGMNAPFKVSQVVDPGGVALLAISHVASLELRQRIEWATPPGTLMYLEIEPELAQFDIWDTGETEHLPVVHLDHPELSDDDIAWWRTCIEEGASFRLIPNRFINMVNELYYGFTLVEEEEEGQPLSQCLLGCYDSTAGLMLHDPTENHQPFTLLLGDVICLLRDGKLPQSYESSTLGGELLPVEGATPEIPDPFLLPRAAYRSVEWTLKSAGVPVPMAGMVQTNQGPALVFNIDEIEEENYLKWAYLRIARSLSRQTLVLPPKWSQLARFAMSKD